MPSITTWTRLEPRARNETMPLEARVYDPLWLLARQWQFGEFHGEDAGSPVMARLRAECSGLTRYQPGPWDNTVTAQGYDSAVLPLETLVEREAIHATTQRGARLAAEAGLHFLRLLNAHGVGRYHTAYLARYALPSPTAAERHALDGDSQRFLDIISRRVPDGARLYAELRPALRPPGRKQGALPPTPTIAPQDRVNVTRAANAWLDWYEMLFSEPWDCRVGLGIGAHGVCVRGVCSYR